MSSINIKNLSSFGQSALKLDQDFTELERLSSQIERLSIDSDSGLDRAQEALLKFGECGQRIGTGIQGLATELNELRVRAEKAAQVVSDRAVLVQQRRTEIDRMLERFRMLGDLVRQTSATVAKFKKLSGEGVTDAEKALIAKQLAEFDSQLEPLISEIHKLKEDARNAKMKTLERNAESLWQSLDAARRKLSHAVGSVSSGADQTDKAI